jgi:predicted membrane channel-forming protein YqfA (hemolysin III family)
VESNQSKKGVKTKLFGVVLIVLGTLDSMLSWRGGFAVSDLYVVLIACGVLLYAIGAIRHGSRA